MKDNKRFLFFDEAKRKKIKEFIEKEFLEVFTYACTFSVKYKDIIGSMKKKGTVTTNQKIESIEDRGIVEKAYLDKHLDMESAKLVQIIEVDYKKVEKETDSE